MLVLGNGRSVLKAPFNLNRFVNVIGRAVCHRQKVSVDYHVAFLIDRFLEDRAFVFKSSSLKRMLAIGFSRLNQKIVLLIDICKVVQSWKLIRVHHSKLKLVIDEFARQHTPEGSIANIRARKLLKHKNNWHYFVLEIILEDGVLEGGCPVEVKVDQIALLKRLNDGFETFTAYFSLLVVGLVEFVYKTDIKLAIVHRLHDKEWLTASIHFLPHGFRIAFISFGHLSFLCGWLGLCSLRCNAAG